MKSESHVRPDIRAASTVLTVRLGTELHAIPIDFVEEVLPALPVERLPQCPSFLRGVVFVRGHLIPVLDAAERLGIAGHDRPMEPHLVCLRVNNRLIGVEFDEALDLLDLGKHPEGTRSLAAEEVGARDGFFAGVVELDGRIVRLLNPGRLLMETETEELERIPRAANAPA